MRILLSGVEKIIQPGTERVSRIKVRSIYDFRFSIADSRLKNNSKAKNPRASTYS